MTATQSDTLRRPRQIESAIIFLFPCKFLTRILLMGGTKSCNACLTSLICSSKQSPIPHGKYHNQFFPSVCKNTLRVLKRMLIRRDNYHTERPAVHIYLPLAEYLWNNISNDVITIHFKTNQTYTPKLDSDKIIVSVQWRVLCEKYRVIQEK